MCRFFFEPFQKLELRFGNKNTLTDLPYRDPCHQFRHIYHPCRPLAAAAAVTVAVTAAGRQPSSRTKAADVRAELTRFPRSDTSVLGHAEHADYGLSTPGAARARRAAGIDVRRARPAARGGRRGGPAGRSSYCELASKSRGLGCVGAV